MTWRRSSATCSRKPWTECERGSRRVSRARKRSRPVKITHAKIVVGSCGLRHEQNLTFPGGTVTTYMALCPLRARMESRRDEIIPWLVGTFSRADLPLPALESTGTLANNYEYLWRYSLLRTQQTQAVLSPADSRTSARSVFDRSPVLKDIINTRCLELPIDSPYQVCFLRIVNLDTALPVNRPYHVRSLRIVNFDFKRNS